MTLTHAPSESLLQPDCQGKLWDLGRWTGGPAGRIPRINTEASSKNRLEIFQVAKIRTLLAVQWRDKETKGD